MLTEKDFDLLNQGLDALRYKKEDDLTATNKTNALMERLLEKIGAPEYVMDIKATVEKENKEKLQRIRDDIVLLKAKLIQLRDKLAVESVIKETNEQKN